MTNQVRRVRPGTRQQLAPAAFKNPARRVIDVLRLALPWRPTVLSSSGATLMDLATQRVQRRPPAIRMRQGKGTPGAAKKAAAGTLSGTV